MPPHMKMLCVDDNADLRNNLRDQFINEDFDVDTAEDGDIALQKLKSNNYDIVLLDMKMPKMDGITVLRELKKTNRLPVIIMLTAVNDVPTALECVRLGAKDYISKPYDPEELLHVVIKTLGSH
ncbi:MAG: response regulator [Ignavibacteriales bacterium]|nr:response regulator [Ignavibacteriales bacterium]